MEQSILTVEVLIHAPKNKVWDYYTQPEHIIHWNFADPGWHCPSASNDLKIGGRYFARMEARDGSFGFDFEAIYTEINAGESFRYAFGGRQAWVNFQEQRNQTKVSVSFHPESENSLELQQDGWQSILNNFKGYVETN